MANKDRKKLTPVEVVDRGVLIINVMLILIFSVVIGKGIYYWGVGLKKHKEEQRIKSESEKEYEKQTIKKMYEEGYQLFKDSSFKQALNKFETILQLYPNSEKAPDALLRKADCLFHMQAGSDTNMISEALNSYMEMMRKYPLHKEMDWVYMRIGVINKMMNVYSRASRYFIKLIEEYPESTLSIRAKYELGECHIQLFEFHEARTTFMDIIETYPDNIYANNSYFQIAHSFYLEAQSLEKEMEMESAGEEENNSSGEFA